MADDITGLFVKIGADVSDLKSGMADAKDTVENSTNAMTDAAQKVAAAFAAAFAIEKVKDYCVEAVESFASVERGLNVLGAQVTASGGNWDGLKEQVNSFLEREAGVYDTTKEKLLPVLNELFFRTHDMAVSFKLMDDAQKLSLVTGKDAATIAEALGLAYAGNTRGISQLGRILGVSTEQSKDLNVVMAKMGEELKTVGDVSGDTKSKIGAMSVSWAEDMEHVGQALSPIVDILHVIEKVIINVIDATLTAGKIIGDVIIGIALELKNLNDIIMHPFSVQAWKDFGANVGGIIKTTFATAHAELQDFAQKTADTWVEQTKQVKMATDSQVADAFRLANANKEAAGEAKDAINEMAEEWKTAVRGIDAEEKAEADHAKAYAKARLATDKADAEAAKMAWVGAVNASLAAKKAADKDWAKYAKSGSDADKTAATVSQKAFDASIKEVSKTRKAALEADKKEDTDYAEEQKKLADMRQQTEEHLFDTLISLSHSKNKELAEIAKDAAVAKATMNTFEGATKALASFPPPVNFVMAALTAIAGGLEIAQIEGVKLAAGGIVNAPTPALIGEGGEPEAVVPLSKAGEMGFGGGDSSTNIGAVHMNLSHVKNPSDFNNSKTRATMTRALLASINDTKRRTGRQLGTI